ncbi:MAG: hypothetical protein MR025_09920 [Helicobacter trogontum]|uniref:hypothetical protein n=1 Tax=Helicobacter trogontum TaxID=50960 RepID=UPI00242E217A|nr:hypothetical protein [Helicobacter trogontum]MCI5787729.1 hypothetical protein [Helicobacter trogontum]
MCFALQYIEIEQRVREFYKIARKCKFKRAFWVKMESSWIRFEVFDEIYEIFGPQIDTDLLVICVLLYFRDTHKYISYPYARLLI